MNKLKRGASRRIRPVAAIRGIGKMSCRDDLFLILLQMVDFDFRRAILWSRAIQSRLKHQTPIILDFYRRNQKENRGMGWVRKAGLEPAWLTPPPPQDGVSASSTTSAGFRTES